MSRPSLAKDDHVGATALADRAIKDQRSAQHTYRTAMSTLIEMRGPARGRSAPRALPPAGADGDDLVRVAERVWYAVLKGS